MKTNQDYKNAALGCLRGNWAPAVLATIIYILLAGVAMGGRELDTISCGIFRTQTCHPGRIIPPGLLLYRTS